MVVLTGKDDEELALRALQEGAEDYLVKGQADAGQLRRSIRYALERRSSEKKLRESEERFRELTEHLHQVLWIIDATEAKILYVSPGYEKMWGRSCQSLIDNPRSYMEGVHPLDQEMMRRENAAMYQTGHIDAECRVLRPDGSVRWVWIRGYPVREQGRIVRLVGVIEDTTEQTAADGGAGRPAVEAATANSANASCLHPVRRRLSHHRLEPGGGADLWLHQGGGAWEAAERPEPAVVPCRRRPRSWSGFGRATWQPTRSTRT